MDKIMEIGKLTMLVSAREYLIYVEEFGNLYLIEEMLETNRLEAERYFVGFAKYWPEVSVAKKVQMISGHFKGNLMERQKQDQRLLNAAYPEYK